MPHSAQAFEYGVNAILESLVVVAEVATPHVGGAAPVWLQGLRLSDQHIAPGDLGRVGKLGHGSFSSGGAGVWWWCCFGHVGHRSERYDPPVITQVFVAEFPIAELVEHPENPRRGDVDAIGRSIDANDFYGAVLVQESTRHVLAGNHRLRAARSLGRTTVPAIVADVDDDRARRILLVDNRTNDLAEYADVELAALLESLSGAGGLVGTGYSDTDMADILARLNPPTLDELGELFGNEPTDADRLGVVTLRVDNDTATRLRSVLADMPGADDSARVNAMLDMTGHEPGFPSMAMADDDG